MARSWCTWSQALRPYTWVRMFTYTYEGPQILRPYVWVSLWSPEEVCNCHGMLRCTILQRFTLHNYTIICVAQLYNYLRRTTIQLFASHSFTIFASHSFTIFASHSFTFALHNFTSICAAHLYSCLHFATTYVAHQRN